MELIHIVKGFSHITCKAVNNSTWAVCTLKLKPSLRICQEVNIQTSTLLCQEARNPPWHTQVFCNSKPKAKIQSLCQWNHFCSPHHKEVCWDAPELRRKSKVLFQVLGLLTVGWNWINHSSTRTDYFFLSPLSGQYEPENSCHGLLSITVKAENLRTRLYSSVFLKTNFKMKRERFTFNNLLLYHTLGRSCS